MHGNIVTMRHRWREWVWIFAAFILYICASPVRAAIIAPQSYTASQCGTLGTNLQLLSTLPSIYLNWTSSYAALDSYLETNALRQSAVLYLPFSSATILPRDTPIPISDSSFAYTSAPFFTSITNSVPSLPLLSRKYLFIDSTSSFTPLVQIDNGNLIVTNFFQQFRLDATLRQCDGRLLDRNETSSVAWSWTFSPAGAISVHSGGSTASDYAWISLSPSASDNSAYQTVYTVSVHATVTLKSGEIGTAFDNTTIVIHPSDLVAIIDGDDRKVSRQLPLVLDASLSNDPDQLTSYADQFQWSCDVCGITIPSGVSNTIAANSLSVGTHVFTLDYTKGSRSTTTNITVEIVNNIAPLAYIPPIASPRRTVNHHERFTAEVAITGDLSLINARFWEEATGQLDIESAILVARTRIRTRRDMVLKENIMTPGLTYKFKFVIVTPTAESHGVLRVHVNDIPQLGSLTISPATGSQIDTVFVARALGWTDAHSPLMYAFHYQMPTASEWIVMRNFAPDPQLYFSFPVADTGIKLRVTVRDAIGGLAMSELTFNVNAQTVNIPTTNPQFLARAIEVVQMDDRDISVYSTEGATAVAWEFVYRMKASLSYLLSKYSSSLACDASCVTDYQTFGSNIASRLATVSDSTTALASASHIPTDVRDLDAQNWIQTTALLTSRVSDSSTSNALQITPDMLPYVQQVLYNGTCGLMKPFSDDRNATFHSVMTQFASTMYVALEHNDASQINSTKTLAVPLMRCMRARMHSGRIDGEVPISVSDINNRFLSSTAGGGSYAVYTFRETRDEFTTFLSTWSATEARSHSQSNVRIALPASTLTTSIVASTTASDVSLAFTLIEYAHDPYHNSTQDADNVILTPIVDVTFFDSQREKLEFSSSFSPLQVEFIGAFDINLPKDYDASEVRCVDFDSTAHQLNYPSTLDFLWGTSSCTLESKSSSILKCKCSHTAYFSVQRIRTPTVYVSLLLPFIIVLASINGLILLTNSAFATIITIACCFSFICFCFTPCIRAMIRFVIMCIKQRRRRNWWRRQVRTMGKLQRLQLSVQRKIEKQLDLLQSINVKLKIQLVQELMCESVSQLPETEYFVKSLMNATGDAFTSLPSSTEDLFSDDMSIASQKSDLSQHTTHSSAAQHKTSVLDRVDVYALDDVTLHMLMFTTNHSSLDMVLKVQICVIQELERLFEREYVTLRKSKQDSLQQVAWIAPLDQSSTVRRQDEQSIVKYFEAVSGDVVIESMVIVCNRVTLLLSMGLQWANADLLAKEAILAKKRAAYTMLQEDEAYERILRRQIEALSFNLDAALAEKDELLENKATLSALYEEFAQKYAHEKFLSIQYASNIDNGEEKCKQRRVLIQGLIKLYESLRQSDAQLQTNLLNLQSELEFVVQRAQMHANAEDTVQEEIIANDSVYAPQPLDTPTAWRDWYRHAPDPVYNERKFQCPLCKSFLFECVMCDTSNPRYSEYACKACLLKRYNVKYLNELSRSEHLLGAVHLNNPREDKFHQHLVDSYLETQWAHQLSSLNPEQFPYHYLTFSNPKQFLGVFDTQQVDQLATILLSKAKFYVVLSKEAERGGNLKSAMSRMEHARFHLTFLMVHHREHLLLEQNAALFEEVCMVLATIYGSLGDMHIVLEDHVKSVELFEEAIHCARGGSTDDHFSTTSNALYINTLYLCYQKQIRLLLFLKRTKEATQHLDDCIDLLERDTTGSVELLHGKLTCQMRKADILKAKGDAVGAFKVYQGTLQKVLMMREGTKSPDAKKKRKDLWKDLKDVIVARKLETLKELQKKSTTTVAGTDGE